MNPTVIIRPKSCEMIKDVRLKLSRTVYRKDKINFEVIQTKSALIL